ncbi:hypothetical protein NDU88_005470 [Pleurodeles waltl]|uniref:Uncharacterized protein n=1 Tax=Pleurodeles waltl TaxID=8319 RepID=A0AAV7QL30_PLEWA|nr:hypothetical protein NDU88_005470 [Pleurodeles waltl]
MKDRENPDDEPDGKEEAVEERKSKADGEREDKWFEAECWDYARDMAAIATAQESRGLGGEMQRKEDTRGRGRKNAYKIEGNKKDGENPEDDPNGKGGAYEKRKSKVDGEWKNEWFEAECWDYARDAEDPSSAQESHGLGSE